MKLSCIFTNKLPIYKVSKYTAVSVFKFELTSTRLPTSSSSKEKFSTQIHHHRFEALIYFKPQQVRIGAVVIR